jgi:phospholipid-transporting ATPase
MMITAASPIAIGLFDQNCNAHTRMENPGLYKTSQNSELFNNKVFWIWIANATLHSIILYWLPMLAYGEGVVWSSVKSSDYLVLGNIFYSCTVITVCVKAGLTLDSWNWACHLSIWGFIALWLENGFFLMTTSTVSV